MEIKSKKVGGVLTAYLLGEIDHHNAKQARHTLDLMIEREKPARFLLDLSGVGFCDSSGLGLVMGRMKKCSQTGSSMSVINPSSAAEKMLEIAGMDKILRIERGQ